MSREAQRTQNEPSTSLSIVQYMHCRMCLAEMPDGTSPQIWSRLDIGYTKEGIQIWCRRHGCNILHIDFEGQQHPANTSRAV